ncbi:hypothetical protein QJS66_22340 [Kocuria rhizophila]|nr:hypothetical protein QJS66_22340 [Kocuria rhizophila]
MFRVGTRGSQLAMTQSRWWPEAVSRAGASTTSSSTVRTEGTSSRGRCPRWAVPCVRHRAAGTGARWAGGPRVLAQGPPHGPRGGSADRGPARV